MHYYWFSILWNLSSWEMLPACSNTQFTVHIPLMLHMLSDNYYCFFLALRFTSCLRVWLCEQSDGGSRTPAGLQHPDVGGAAHRLHHLLCGNHPSLRHPAAAQRQEGQPGAGVRQVRHAWFCVFVFVCVCECVFPCLWLAEFGLSIIWCLCSFTVRCSCVAASSGRTGSTSLDRWADAMHSGNVSLKNHACLSLRCGGN